MKILLIQPAKAPATIGGEDLNIFEPLALEYIAAGVKADHDVMILDMRFEKDLQSVLSDFGPHIVGITSYTVNVKTVKRLFKEIKTFSPEIYTVVGGHHATVSPEDFLEPSIDLVVSGEGVFIFKEVVGRIETKKGFDGMKGVAFEAGGKICRSDFEGAEDPDALPPPARELTEKYRGRYYTEWMRPLASIRTSKGCPHRCSFCGLWKLTGGRYLQRKPENIARELLEIKENYVFLDDDESLINTARMLELAGLIKEYGIKKRYFLSARSDTVLRSSELLDAWKEIGLERVFMGIECCRDEDLKLIRKGTTVQTNEDAIRLLQGKDLQIYASFMVRPDFTSLDFSYFRQYCKDLELNFATFAVLTPLPGTDFYEQVKDRIITRNYDYFDLVHTLLPTRLPLEDFYEELYWLYKKAIPLRTWVSFLNKYPVSKLPSVMMQTRRLMSGIRNVHRDYTV